MQSISNEQIANMLRFAERKAEFILDSTVDVESYHDFLTSLSGMILFNSTCMCLQTIGNIINKVDTLTSGNLLARYPSTPWKEVIEMRNIILNAYHSIDPELIFTIAKTRLVPLLADVRLVLAELDKTI